MIIYLQSCHHFLCHGCSIRKVSLQKSSMFMLSTYTTLVSSFSTLSSIQHQTFSSLYTSAVYDSLDSPALIDWMSLMLILNVETEMNIRVLTFYTGTLHKVIPWKAASIWSPSSSLRQQSLERTLNNRKPGMYI